MNALKARILVVLKAAPTYLIGFATVVAVVIQQVSTLLPPGWQDNAAQAGGYVAAMIAAAVAIIRRVTPVVEGDIGLLPPDRPDDPVYVREVDRGDIGLGILLKIVALVLLLVAGAIGADWITSVYALAFLAFGLAAWVLSDLVP